MRPLIGLVLENFSKISETFILNEILDLERQGLELHIFSLRCPSGQDTHTTMAQVCAPVTYLPSLLPKFDRDKERELINAQVGLFEQDSEAYFQILKLYLNRHKDQKYNEFLQGCCLAWKIQNLGITHLHAHFSSLPAATVEIAHAFAGVPYSIKVHTRDTYLSDQAIQEQIN